MYITRAGQYSFETGIYRPPSEGGSYSLLLRVTRNCPWNKCAFCAMYKGEKFSPRSVEEVVNDIDSISAICSELREISLEKGHGGKINRGAVMGIMERYPELNTSHGLSMVLDWLSSGSATAFLQDANSPVLPTKKLVLVLKHLRKKFPSLKRVTSYARAKTLSRKSVADLKAIRTAGLDRLHVGLETGYPALLEKIKKGATPNDHVLAGKKTMEAGFQLSEYWMPGLGGKDMWEGHAVETSAVLNEINPQYIRSRPFFPAPGTPLYEEYRDGTFQPLSSHDQLVELRMMVENLQVTSRVCFDHAGNFWIGKGGRTLFNHSYEGYKFPDEKQRVLTLIEEGIHVQNKYPSGPPAWLVR